MSKISFFSARHGIFTHYSADECIGASLRNYGEWAESEIHQIKQYVGEGAFILDVGGNVGTHTIALARHVGDQGFVVAIEAQTEIHHILTTNIVINQLQDRAMALNALAGSKPGTSNYCASTDKIVSNFGAESFATDRGDVQSDRAVVTTLPIITLDELKIQRCDLIKIDVEGMELEVLKGALNILDTFNPILYFEQNDDRNFAAIYEILKSRSYRLYWHISNPFNTNNFNKSAINIFGGAVEANVLALPEGVEMTTGLVEIMDAGFNPPIPSLAEGLPGEAVPCDTVASAENLFVPAAALAEAKAQLADVLQDRQKAQVIIEHQHAEIQSMKANIEDN